MAAQVRSMTEGRPLKIIFAFAIPLMLGNIFQQLYVIVDTAVVGQVLGVEALASIGAADWINWMVLGIASGFTQGFAIPIAQRFGAEDYDGLRKNLAAYLLLAAATAIFILVGGQLVIRPLLELLNTPENIIGGAEMYLRVSFAGAPVVVAYNMMASVLRALGNSRSPLVAMIIAGLLNVGLDLLFVMGLGWGIFGAAFATVLAQVVSCIYCILVLRQIPFIFLRREDWKVRWKTCWGLLKLGFPVAMQNTIIAVGGMVVQSVVNMYGYLFIAGYTATNKLYGLLEVAATSYGFAMTTYVGQNLGARKYERIRKGVHAGVLVAVITSLVITVAMVLFGKPLLSLFISGDAHEVSTAMGYAHDFLMTMSIPLWVLYLLHVYRNALMGLGDAVTPMASGFMEFVMRVGAAFILPGMIGVFGIYFGEVIAWAGAILLLIPVYYIRLVRLKKKWVEEPGAVEMEKVLPIVDGGAESMEKKSQ